MELINYFILITLIEVVTFLTLKAERGTKFLFVFTRRRYYTWAFLVHVCFFS